VTARVLCRFTEIEDGQGRGFTLEEGADPRDIFVVRQGRRVFGYVNSCPHQGTPLDWVPDQFISKLNGRIMCATHGAQFEIDGGTCVRGPCKGERLRGVAVSLDGDGRVVLGVG
jgi:nitrite reductase/ring-hydroxylating ferredoxin subunit